jgi:hypothetical protein
MIVILFSALLFKAKFGTLIIVPPVVADDDDDVVIVFRKILFLLLQVLIVSFLTVSPCEDW